MASLESPNLGPNLGSDPESIVGSYPQLPHASFSLGSSDQNKLLEIPLEKTKGHYT